MRIPVLAGLLAISIAACDNDRPKNHFALLEVIDLVGTCRENHLAQSDSYSGRVVRWKTLETGEVATYGFVSRKFSAQRTIEEASHPTVYHSPDIISFTNINIDTTRSEWTLQGVSERGEDSEGNSQGYNSVCQLEVTHRGKELPPE
jgi:hypothetical protein